VGGGGVGEANGAIDDLIGATGGPIEAVGGVGKSLFFYVFFPRKSLISMIASDIFNCF
jgi:hypothetical protein